MTTPLATGLGADNTPRTMAAWQALAGEIANLVVDSTTGVPNPAKAGELLTVFSEINQYCDNRLYGDRTTALPTNPLAQLLLDTGAGAGANALPGIELFAKQATRVLGAIANDATTNILANGFFPAGTTIVDSSIAAAGYGAATTIPTVNLSTLLQGTTGSSDLGIANLNSAILKTLLTPHRQVGLESCAIDSTIISETINNPARMAGMYKDLLTPTPRGTTGETQTPARTVVKLKQFTPFLRARTFAGNTNSFPMTNLDSMLVHSLAYMLYGNNNVSATPTAYGLAAAMPTKYLGAGPNGAFNVDTTTGKISAIDVGQLLLRRVIVSIIKTPLQAVSDSALGRPYIPSHFNLAGFNHGQNFLGSAATSAATMIFTDTNWIDPRTGCPTYWQIDPAAATYQKFTVDPTSMTLPPPPGTPLGSGQILMMPKV
jgi:hypothetical protein